MDLGARRALLRGGGRERRHDREGRPDLRLAAVPDHARVPDPAVRRDARARRRLLRAPRGGRLPARLRRRRLRPVHEVPAPRLGLLHRRRRLASSWPTATSSSQAGTVDAAHRGRGRDDRRHRAAGRPHRLRHRLRLDERLGRRPHLPGRRRQGRQGLGPRLGHARRTRARGRASSATCGSRPSRRRCGSTAATCTSPATTRSYLALQLKARMEGIDTPVYGLQEVHHLS